MARNRIKEGDEYGYPVSVSLNGEPLDVANVELIEFCIGHVRKTWPDEVSYDAEEGIFYVPITQEESFCFPADDVIEADVRVRFLGGGVIGAEKKRYVFVNDALSEAVI